MTDLEAAFLFHWRLLAPDGVDKFHHHAIM